jgi:uncharacterized protein YndB with AHSA1/START domain
MAAKERPAVSVISEEIRYAVLIRADRARVYDAMTTEDGLNGWFTHSSTIDARAGGEIRFRWQDWGPEKYTGEHGGPIIAAQQPERFVFEWNPDNASYRTRVEMNFEEAEGGTIIRLKESGFQDTPDGRRKILENAAGWGEALTLLKFFVEHGVRY